MDGSISSLVDILEESYTEFMIEGEMKGHLNALVVICKAVIKVLLSYAVLILKAVVIKLSNSERTRYC